MSCLLWKTATLLSLVWAVGGQSSGDLRLVGSRPGDFSGRLEVYYSRQWGTVCDDLFSPDDAVVACHQLGFSNYTRYGTVGALGFSEASSSTPTWLDNLRCLGTESRLGNCPANPIGVEDCTHSEDIALVCTANTANTTSPNGDLRLVGNSGRTGGSSGRLEVYYSGHWGTVCDDSFSVNDARVACRQLGFSTYTRYGNVVTLGFFQASSSTRTWLDELRCRGSESRLINCPANTIGVEDCTHPEDIALICTEGTATSASGLDISITLSIVVGFIPIIVAIFMFVIMCIIVRRRRLARPPPRNLNTNTASTTTTTVTNTQNTAYSMNQRSPNSNQPPPPNVHGPQSAAAYPTGQYSAPSYHTSYPQQPPAPEKPPSALYFSGGEAPPPYPG